jgi:hypothetical protein
VPTKFPEKQPKRLLFSFLSSDLNFPRTSRKSIYTLDVWVTRGEFMTVIEKDDPTEAPESGDKQPSPPDQK